MRLVLMAAAFAALATLSACDDAVVPAVPDPVVKNPDPALASAAERECAEMTNYEPGKMTGMTSEMRALMQREYASCVAKVSGAK